MNLKNKNLKTGAYVLLGAFLLMCLWGIFVPYSLVSKSQVVYTIEKGQGYNAIAKDLQTRGIINTTIFFDAYALLSGNFRSLQAGSYNISPSMSVFAIVRTFATGDVIKNTITIIEGWDLQDIANALETKNIMPAAEFLAATNAAAAKNIAPTYSFLKDKPSNASLEGYIFPDTYQIPLDAPASELLQKALNNFDKKLTPDLRSQIAAQHKSIFEIVTMASLLEKEVQTPSDKKIVAGILWKRIQSGVPLQLDATISYITGKTDAQITTQDKTINSPYNTYKYYGLPLGPICNPGINSILAAINPVASPYWYYLTDPKTGQTIFSETLDQQNAAIQKYLR